MHIQWRVCPTTRVEVPYVTLTPAEMLEGKSVLKAKESYQLSGKEADMVKEGHEWLSGFTAMLAPLSGYYQADNEGGRFLLNNKDVRLPKGLWIQVRTSEAGTVATWSNGQDLDDVIQFDSAVEKVNIRRINRELMPKEQALGRPYRVVRHHIEAINSWPAETLVLRPGLAIKECESYLHDTYWARIPEILGKVSDSFVILTACLTMRFTEQFGPTKGLGAHYLHPLEGWCPVCSLS